MQFDLIGQDQNAFHLLTFHVWVQKKSFDTLKSIYSVWIWSVSACVLCGQISQKLLGRKKMKG